MKLFKKFILSILFISLFINLTACRIQTSEDPAISGTYIGQYTKLVGDSKRSQGEQFSLELNEDGTGIHHRDNLDCTVEWTNNGNIFTMTEKVLGVAELIQYSGTLENGILTIYNGDPENKWTYEYVYKYTLE